MTMKKIDLGQTINTLANVGVIAGIALLAYELNQNNEYLSAQAKFNLHHNKWSIYDEALESAEFVDFLTKVASDEPLTAQEKLRLDVVITRHLGNWLWEYEEVLDGRLAEEDLPLESWCWFFQGEGSLGLPQFDEVWEGFRHGQNPRFVSFMEENVIDC
jgi:hypothetical protein